MYKCEIIIYWSNLDNTCVTEVPELSGCMADGATTRLQFASIKSRSLMLICYPQTYSDLLFHCPIWGQHITLTIS